MIFSTDPHFIHKSSNNFFSIKFTLQKVEYFLLSQINKSEQNSIEWIIFSYQQQAPKSMTNNMDQLVLVSDIRTL